MRSKILQKTSVLLKGTKFTKSTIISLGIFALTGIAGLSGYIFNFYIAGYWDTITLGKLLAAIAVFSFISLPATLLTLPMSKWSSQTLDWRRKFVKLDLILLTVCALMSAIFIVTLSGWSKLLHIQSTWLIPLLLWTVASYIHALQVGVLMGRRSYGIMGVTTAIPVIGKLIVVIIFTKFGVSSLSIPLWSIAIPSWLAVFFGFFFIMRLSNKDTTVNLPSSLWASGFVTLTSNSWMMVDTILAGYILIDKELAIYAIISTVGKIPFQLANIVANIGISESGWERGSRRKVHILIGLIGLISIAGTFIMSPIIMNAFNLTGSDSILLLIYMFGNTVLSIGYFEMGAAAQRSKHIWGPFACSLIIWCIWVLYSKGDVIHIVYGLTAAQVLGLVITILLVKMKRDVPLMNNEVKREVY